MQAVHAGCFLQLLALNVEVNVTQPHNTTEPGLYNESISINNVNLMFHNLHVVFIKFIDIGETLVSWQSLYAPKAHSKQSTKTI